MNQQNLRLSGVSDVTIFWAIIFTHENYLLGEYKDTHTKLAITRLMTNLC